MPSDGHMEGVTHSHFSDDESSSLVLSRTQSREKNLLQGQPDGPWRAGTHPRSVWLQSGDTAGYSLFHLQPPTSLMPRPSGPSKIALPFCFPLFIHPVFLHSCFIISEAHMFTHVSPQTILENYIPSWTFQRWKLKFLISLIYIYIHTYIFVHIFFSINLYSFSFA